MSPVIISAKSTIPVRYDILTENELMKITTSNVYKCCDNIIINFVTTDALVNHLMRELYTGKDHNILLQFITI